MNQINWQFCKDPNEINDVLSKGGDYNWEGFTNVSQIINIIYHPEHRCYMVFWANKGDLISRQDALKPFCIAPDGTRIPEVDCDNFPVEFSVEFIKKHLLSLPSADRPTECNTTAPSVKAEQVTGKLKNPCDSLLTDDSEECKEKKSKLAEAIHKPDYSYEADMVRRLKESLSAETVQVNGDLISQAMKEAQLRLRGYNVDLSNYSYKITRDTFAKLVDELGPLVSVPMPSNGQLKMRLFNILVEIVDDAVELSPIIDERRENDGR